MKTLKSILIFVASVYLLFACNKDEPAIVPGNAFQNDDVITSGKVFKVGEKIIGFHIPDYLLKSLFASDTFKQSIRIASYSGTIM